MNRVKEIKNVILGGGEILAEMVETKRKSGIVLPDKGMVEDHSSAYGVIVALGNEITDLEVGDIILKTRTDKALGYTYKDKELMILSRYNIAVAVKPVNFDTNEELTA